jgi:hypothetical protein
MSISSEREHPKPCISGHSGSFLARLEISKGPLPSVDPHSGPPCPPGLVQTDTSVPTTRTAMGRLILLIFGRRNYPEIDAPIIEAIPVDVVSESPVTSLQIQDDTVEQEPLKALPPGSSASDGIPIARQAPCPLIDPLSIGGVNQGIGADRPITGSDRDANGILRDGIIPLHRQFTPVGVTPRGVASTAGVSRVNYTMPYLVGVVEQEIQMALSRVLGRYQGAA